MTCTGCVSLSQSTVGLVEETILYQPSNELDYARVPSELEYEEVEIQTADGVQIEGWYCPVENPRAVVLFAHGNAGNLAHRSDLLLTWTKRLQVSVLAFDYRGYGNSEGTPSEAGLVADARAARAWLAKREGIDEQQVVLYGRSLGGAVMVQVAAEDGARGLILESTFDSLSELADSKFPMLGVGQSLSNQYPSAELIGNYRGPLLMAHGTDDNTIPIEHGRKLFAAANQPKQFIKINEADHNWFPEFSYLLTVSRFLDELP
ncbi:alpha/beta hydrolase [Aeoliella mucimassa]|nr:alpha/beta hydrolase [Aeoliella mucimassa]